MGTSDTSAQNWALGCGRSPEQLVSRLPNIPTMAYIALNTPVLGTETRVWDSSAQAPSHPCQCLASCPWSFSYSYSHGLLLNVRYADRFSPPWPQRCPWSWILMKLYVHSQSLVCRPSACPAPHYAAPALRTGSEQCISAPWYRVQKV